MKRRIAGLLALLTMSSLLLSGCSARPVPEGIEEEAAGQAGQAIVELLLAGDSQGVVDAFDPAMRESLALTAENIQSVAEPALNSGAYISTYKTMAVGGQSKGYDGDYVVVGIYCEHEKIDVVYEMSFDTDLELIGLDAKQKRKALFG